MFSFFKKNPIKKLDKRYEAKLEQAMQAQRNGDIKGYAMITAEAEEIKLQMLALEKDSAK
ncbi:DUF6435 family protein [Colwellia echini]|uniref:Lacal_2735 family protein n=1 Tax=Colwellia echini TaxID=1982103 RepID=A0ABY3MUF6_9GAMM|nr:DUF6435 family protein [Colwellia echini]TYK64832.1 Lacal_2735 family protein [Colwellia echini]